MRFSEVFKLNPNHDERGRFASGGVGNADFNDADRRLIDIKPDRPLAGVPDDLRKIDSLIPGADYIPYSQTPFFDKLQEMQGTPDGDHLSGTANKAARDLLFQSQPIENVPVKNLTFTQNVVNYPDVSKFFGTPPPQFVGKQPPPAQVVEYGGRYYLMDGHHRAVADVVKGHKTMRSHVLHISLPKVTKFQWLTQALKYNENHDEHGRFASGGGTFPSIKGVKGFVRNIFAKVKAVEPTVTETLQGLASNVGGSMAGLEFRLKSPDSLERKIRDTAKIERQPVAKVAENIKDALRYTMIFPADQYRKGVADTDAKMADLGFKKIKSADYWSTLGPDGKLAVYKGINNAYEDSNGVKFELQFHTPDSLAVKEHNHSLYEQARLLTTDAETKRQLEDMMRKNAQGVTLP